MELSAPGGFFADPDFDYEARLALGSTAVGFGDVGLVLATLDRIADGDRQSWFDAWTASAADLSARGEKALGHGHLATARWALLTAAELYAKALVFVDGLPDQSVCCLPLDRAARAGRGDGRLGGLLRRVEVPYEETKLPGYLLRLDAIRDGPADAGYDQWQR